jgi:hypothetical protein
MDKLRPNRRLVLVVGLAANVFLVALALAPGLVTYAEKLPEIACPTCSMPETRAALLQAVAFGRAQIVGLIHSHAWLLLAAAVINAGAVVALFWKLRSNCTVERDARKK